MISFHRLNWIIGISFSILSLAACSKKAPEPETPPGDVVTIDGESENAGNAEAKSNAEVEPAKDSADTPTEETAPNADNAPKPDVKKDDDPKKTKINAIKQASLDQIASQPPIAKSLNEEFEFPKCMVCRYCEDRILWASGSDCRLSASQVDKIIKQGTVNQWNEYGQSPLMLAKDLQSVQKLLAAGASPNLTDEFGNSAMDYARTKEIQQELLKAGFKPNPDKEYPLFNPNYEIYTDEYLARHIKEDKKLASNPSKKIDEYMFDVNCTWTDSDAAFGHGYRDDRIVRGWIKKAKDVNARDEDGRTPLFYVNYAKEARLLIAAGADINAQDNDGNTPLVWFMSENRFESVHPDEKATEALVSTLIAAGADTTITNSAGKSANDYLDKDLWDMWEENRP